VKLGTSLSRCARDIYDGTVNINEVLVIVARTDVDPTDDKQWSSLWNGYGGGNSIGSMYSQPEWSSIPAEDEQKLRDIILDLYDAGKIHQPRKFGSHPVRMNQYWYDLVLTADVVDSNPAAKRAWENYKLLANLS
jgi:hypothetical protein